MKTAIIIQGPTAAGKTAIAIALAERLQTAVVSADSRQCYLGMDIGTAKPTRAELNRVPHYFIDEYPVTTLLTAADYEAIALQYLENIFTENDYAVVCGGTGLYIKALCEGMDAMPPVTPAIDQEITAQYNLLGIDWLREQVQQQDPTFYATGETDNPARMLRALVFIRSTKESITTYRTGIKKERGFRILKIGIELPREVLYARINARVDTMMLQGLEAEARRLCEYRHLKNLQT
ncbi:MAG: tRNA (adenosine(37)-N6)-dimethylallyltransferase MiaA, partial [Taibaiella sp.]|nr:tRNA (adenosine(37)-N6)-dimethylallyltransferase MiaA [Taibaiella sp.]